MSFEKYATDLSTIPPTASQLEEINRLRASGVRIAEPATAKEAEAIILKHANNR